MQQMPTEGKEKIIDVTVTLIKGTILHRLCSKTLSTSCSTLSSAFTTPRQETGFIPLATWQQEQLLIGCLYPSLLSSPQILARKRRELQGGADQLIESSLPLSPVSVLMSPFYLAGPPDNKTTSCTADWTKSGHSTTRTQRQLHIAPGPVSK